MYRDKTGKLLGNTPKGNGGLSQLNVWTFHKQNTSKSTRKVENREAVLLDQGERVTVSPKFRNLFPRVNFNRRPSEGALFKWG